jgi:hypothetical protein
MPLQTAGSAFSIDILNPPWLVLGQGIRDANLMNRAKLCALVVLAVLIFTAGCAAIEPTPEDAAAANTRPWGGPPTPTVADQYPWAALIMDNLGGLTR